MLDSENLSLGSPLPPFLHFHAAPDREPAQAQTKPNRLRRLLITSTVGHVHLVLSLSLQPDVLGCPLLEESEVSYVLAVLRMQSAFAIAASVVGNDDAEDWQAFMGAYHSTARRQQDRVKYRGQGWPGLLYTAWGGCLPR